jgi:hypothetical protein
MLLILTYGVLYSLFLFFGVLLHVSLTLWKTNKSKSWHSQKGLVGGQMREDYYFTEGNAILVARFLKGKQLF